MIKLYSQSMFMRGAAGSQLLVQSERIPCGHQSIEIS